MRSSLLGRQKETMEREGRKIQNQGMELEMMLKPGGREIRKCKENKMTKGQKCTRRKGKKHLCQNVSLP